MNGSSLFDWFASTSVALVFLLAVLLSSQPSQGAEAEAQLSHLTTPFFSMLLPADATARTGFTLELTLLSPEGIEAKVPVECVLPQGVASNALRCDYAQPIPLSELVVIENSGRLRVDGSLAQIAQTLDLFNWGITKVEPNDPPEPDYQPAEAYWHGIGPFGWWTCEIEYTDLLRCSNFCGGGHYDISVDEVGATNNPYFEPSCEVTCECWDGGEDEWIDPPKVDGIE